MTKKPSPCSTKPKRNPPPPPPPPPLRHPHPRLHHARKRRSRLPLSQALRPSR
ncbi:hypothetical protein K6U21_13855 [Vibrio vulnificus]|uniref:hypothetical protein n=1 Tax=Vibrio vulnificus TaxID=672 RepID=UPI001EECC77C|nr:hypothetical protein [Vibrio vulnificus]MCG6305251.1 hypothetical protein [Vibrio vulnificus]